ncbi:peptidase S11 [Verminephrobacter aporrectodeae subsp. tuberculatae]|uniref:serine hydrolase n=1 Tax=Verminephrobacter aporrectodeae TaxID=1110389 RepID=UPI002237FFE1|nr:serine hydrolase [Verminephrobacter aporrectodeae]MCW5221577.1 peptidase S11 [Verminephrobacter aporrectodeae subsp. tuberculatae]MCW5257892.1 peptidase S11 [Verminephrobacter aporrectodeae subsp. tuberculatae]MCW5290867.1 peptidase S11 [Verminephrobacter aporrectodeae subsp. tuberculatae]MCW8199188.1 peptidase S11 [Verminephrobacter aporrectodeae subsp. tuberculatae]
MPHRSRAAVNRFFQLLGLAIVSMALIASAAHAGGRTAAKKKQLSSASHAKRTVAARKQAAPPPGALRGRARTVKTAPRAVYVPPKLSFGQIAGLHRVDDPLDLKSSAALIVDQDTHEVLFSKNDHAVLPIASLTKLMTGLLVSQAGLPMDELLAITQDDVDTEKGSRSRLTVGSTLARGEMLHLALMSSENRAAHALGRTFPGGLRAFVGQMNAKARLLGMTDTRYVDPTGLSSQNQSSARDLAVLVNVAHGDPLLRMLSTSLGHEVALGEKTLQYNNTNDLVKKLSWDIGLQKTGYISEAGRCLVMQAQIAGRKLIMVFLDSADKISRLGDAERVRHWIESMPGLTAAPLQAARNSRG